MTNVTSTATVIIGLLLLMLSHGLRRRKRRAWQATTVLLAFSAVIHLLHGYRIQGAAAVAVLVGTAVLPERVLRRGRSADPVAGGRGLLSAWSSRTWRSA